MSEIDLNLLRVFDALVELRSVTKAAHRLGLTQSAVSHALGRLRQSVGDPLFVRSAGGLQPTARAIEITPGIRDGLVRLRGALAPSLFDPATAERIFTISAGSYFCILLIPELILQARRVAPRVSFRIVLPSPELLPELDEGSIDLALGAFGRIPARLRSESLGAERFVWIASADNPIIDDPARIARLDNEPRLVVAAGRPFPGLGAYTSEGGLERRVIATEAADDGTAQAAVHDAVTAAATIARTDLVALVPRRLALDAAASYRLAIIDTARETEAMDMMMLWHAKLDADAGLTWLRALILDALKNW